MKSEKDEAASSALCAICQSPIQEGETKTNCPNCHAEFHQDCWDSNGGCAVYGCASVPTIESRSSVEVPVAYWGQENKLCPSCNQQILAAAVRCRHCGAVFDSARPQDRLEFSRTVAVKDRIPTLKKSIIRLFIFCLLPFTAPVAAIVTWFWRHSHEEDLPELPALYPALLVIGCAVAAAETTAIVVVAVISHLVHT